MCLDETAGKSAVKVLMKRLIGILLCVGMAANTSASWYWPFGSDDSTADDRRPRLSELMEPASILIDEASDLAEDGKSVEAVEKYRQALAALDAIEAENRDWVDKPEFATLRNKRAYVNATIDSLLLMQVKANARAVAVSDTTALERKLAEEKLKKGNPSEKKPEKLEKKVKDEPRTEKKTATSAPAARPLSKRTQAMADLSSGDYDAAALVIAEILEEKPDDAAALNLKAVLETQRGNYKAAEQALDRAISVHPRSHYAYYNMANLILQVHPSNKSGARRYYETGRDVGGPRNLKLEERLK